MRIGLIAPVGTPVREHGSDSIESLVWLLGRELTRRGHEVTTFAAGGSETCGELVATLPGPYGKEGSPGDWYFCEWVNLCRAIAESARFDIVHSHVHLWGLPIERLARAPMVHTLHMMPFAEEGHVVALMPQARITAISNYQWSAFANFMPIAVIHHGLDSAHFTFRAQPDDYVCYLGRFMADKGPLQAVRTARALGLRLVLAGPPNDYFRKHIEPLVDGKTVEYAGFVSGERKCDLLGGARALLYPVQAPEPFGLVMIEAMMCGTPVAAVRLGAVPEIVDEGVSGHYAEATGDFAATVAQAMTLDRQQVRARALARFSCKRMAEEYLRVYQRIMTA
jgi:glycosyltransferase involved in cell wall biosynthesis